MDEKRPRGRPPKSGTGRPRSNFTIRLRDDLRAALEEAAKGAGRPISEEIETRLEASRKSEASLDHALDLQYGQRLAALLLVVAKAISDTGRHVGFLQTLTPEGSERWMEEPQAYQQAMSAAKLVLDAMAPTDAPRQRKLGVLPSGLDLDSVMASAGEGFARSMLSALAGQAISSSLEQWASGIRERLGEEAVARIAQFLSASPQLHAVVIGQPLSQAPSAPRPTPKRPRRG